MSNSNPSFLFAIAAAAAAISAALIFLLLPLLQRCAVVPPNARSSHHVPTPQGGGIAVVAAAIAVAVSATFVVQYPHEDLRSLRFVIGATVFIALVGAVDDIRNIGVVPRLALQAIAVAVVLAALPADMRVLPGVSWWSERVLLLVGGVWFVNLTNFMDGIDWMTVAEAVPITAGLTILGLLGVLPPYATVVALALGGALLGFAPFNRPVARLFLGDVGSLPIGLLLGWLLLLVAGSGHLTAAVLLPLYYVCDASITLVRRIVEREPFWRAHRSHFYQRALERGFTVKGVVSRVFALNLVLTALAIATVLVPGHLVSWTSIALGIAAVGWLLSRFSRGSR